MWDGPPCGGTGWESVAFARSNRTSALRVVVGWSAFTFAMKAGNVPRWIWGSFPVPSGDFGMGICMGKAWAWRGNRMGKHGEIRGSLQSGTMTRRGFAGAGFRALVRSIGLRTRLGTSRVCGVIDDSADGGCSQFFVNRTIDAEWITAYAGFRNLSPT